MLSRVAENMYWFARYLERAENTARLISVHTNLLLDLPKTLTFGWAPLIAITGCHEGFIKKYQDFTEQNVIHFLLGEKENSGSLLSSLVLARENLRTTRDIVPREAWEHLNDLYLFANDYMDRGLSRYRRHDYLKHIIGCSQLIAGLLEGTMSHDTTYDFILLGRNLERADMTTRILDVRSEDLLIRHYKQLSPFDNIQWMSVLKSLTGYQMYRRHVRMRVTAGDVLRFLLQDENFPRALAFCLKGMEDSLRRLPRHHSLLSHIDDLSGEVQQADIRELAKAGAALSSHLDDLQLKLAGLHDQISAIYFSSEPIEAETAQPRAATAASGMSQSQQQTN